MNANVLQAADAVILIYELLSNSQVLVRRDSIVSAAPSKHSFNQIFG